MSDKLTFKEACVVLNLSSPDFRGCSFDEAVKRLDEFKLLAKSKFRTMIKLKHVDKGGESSVTRRLIEANKLIREAYIRPSQPQQNYITYYNYNYVTFTWHSGSSSTGY